MVPVNHGGLSSCARFVVHGDSGDERCLGGYAYRIAKPKVRNVNRTFNKLNAFAFSP